MTEAMNFIQNLKVGISIGNTLDSTKEGMDPQTDPAAFETAWGNPVIRKELVDAILDAGFNVVRIPVSWKNHLGPAPDFKIVESWMDRVQEVVNYVYGRGAYVILNLHHEDWNYPYYANRDAACQKMCAVWKQIAERFADYDNHLIFEGQNEPRKVGTELEWNGGDEEGWEVVDATNAAFIDTIRSMGGRNEKRYLMIPCYAANCSVGIKHLTVPSSDKRLIVSVHAYEPYEFALQIPGREHWNQDTKVIDELMQNLNSYYISKGIPVILGEFGAMNKNGNEADRAEWVKYYVKAAAKVNIPCVWWDNGQFEGEGELFGLFDRNNYTVVYPKIVKGLMEGIV